jgi:Arc/MetJ-type ribon-helix-helix transcriptional regulator
MGKGKNTHETEGNKVLSRPKYVDSVKAAANSLGYPEAAIQALKDQGCAAWQGSRCYLDTLEEWIDENGLPEVPESELDRWNLEIAKERARKLKIQNDIEEGKTVSMDDVVAFLIELGLRTKNRLKKTLEDEAPHQQAGKAADEIRAINKDLVDEICEGMQREMREWKS